MLTKKANSNIRMAIFILFIFGLLFSIMRPADETICEARINKQVVGYGTSRSDIASSIDKIEEELAAAYFVDELSPYYETVFSEISQNELSATSYETLKREVFANQKFVTPGYELTIDNKVYARAINKSDLEFLIDNVKSRLKKDNENIQAVVFMESVEIAPGNIFLRDSIVQTESDLLVERLLTGREQIETYTVKSGDTLTAIAANQGLSVSDIVEANPETDVDKIYAGQKLFLSKPSPILHRK
ncbi:MAG: LysM peptidoglycan-binding domain-containing protein [Peptostreptococcaceae bacterium]|nr:LysM peptidoglycan-binding domain-containing protein [Peptostreptococcaceae bacterium]